MKRSSRTLEPCEVYIFTASEEVGPIYVKVGVSRSPEARLASIQTGCPIRIVAGKAIKCTARVIAVAMEASMHEELAAYRCSGEWFRFDAGSEAHSDALEQAIQRHARGMGVGVRDVDLVAGFKLMRSEAKARAIDGLYAECAKEERDRAAAWNVAPAALGLSDTQ